MLNLSVEISMSNAYFVLPCHTVKCVLCTRYWPQMCQHFQNGAVYSENTWLSIQYYEM